MVKTKQETSSLSVAKQSTCEADEEQYEKIHPIETGSGASPLSAFGFAGAVFVLAETQVLARLAESIDLTPEDKRGRDDNAQDFTRSGALIGVAIFIMLFTALPIEKTRRTVCGSYMTRLLQGWFLCYALLATYIALLPRQEARTSFRAIDDDLSKVPFLMKKSREDCRMFTPDHPDSIIAGMWGNLVNVHAFAHFSGWLAKMILFHDWYWVGICATSWEFVEIIFRHNQFNFWECWWDHMFLDVFGCNTLGMIVGYLVLKKVFPDTKFHYFAWDPTKSDGRHASASILTPGFLGSKKFILVQNANHLLTCTFFLIAQCCIEGNSFILARDLQIPSNHKLVTLRLLAWVPPAIPIMRDFYAYSFQGRRMGFFVWAGMYILAVESTLSIRHSHDQFKEVMPWQSQWMLTGLATIWVYLFCIALSNGQARKTNKAD